MENVGSERWQWALDTVFGKGRVQTGTPAASRISAWVFRELKRHVARQGFHGFFAKISDEILPEDIPLWYYGGPVRPDLLPYHRTWTLPLMALHHGFQGYGQWAFYWGQDTSRIVWIDEHNRIEISPANCGFRDGWRDVVLFQHLIEKAGRAEYDKIVGPHVAAVLRVAGTRDPTYPSERRDVPSVTAIANADDLLAVNDARRRALEALTSRVRDSGPGSRGE